MGKTWKNYDETKNVLSKINTYKNIVVYDIETTGLSKKNDKIIQFSAIRFALPEWKELDRVDIYIKAPFKINGSPASVANGITDEKLDEFGISENDAFKMITEFIHEDDVIVGYNNISFDDKWMEVLYANHNKSFMYKDSIDVYKFAKIIVPPELVTVEVQKLGPDGRFVMEKKASYKLEILANLYDPENTIKFHSSIEDVEATAMVFAMTIADALVLIKEAEEEENKRKAVPRQDATVTSISLFNPSSQLKRVYVQTDQGTIFYDEVKHEWRAKTGAIDSINMIEITEQVFKKLKINSEKELFNMVVKVDKDNKARKLFGFKNFNFTEEELEHTYNELVNDYLDKSLNENLDKSEEELELLKQERLQEYKSSYNRLKKLLKEKAS